MLTGQIADILNEELRTGNPVEFRNELLSIYQQIVPGKDASERMGRYHDHQETFRDEPRLVNSLARLLIDAGLVAESDRVMNHFYGGLQSIRERVHLSDKERGKLVDYIHSRLFGEMFFNKRYGISAEQKPRAKGFAKNSRRRKRPSQDVRYTERNFQTRYKIETEPTRGEETSQDFLDEDDSSNFPEPIFATTFNERYAVHPQE